MDTCSGFQLPQRREWVAQFSECRPTWIGDDTAERQEFLKLCASAGVRLPQTECEFHAARMYIDDLDKAVYDFETWGDYVQLKSEM